MMNELYHQKIERWIEAGLKNLTVRNPISVHINDLLNIELEEPQIVSISLMSFTALVIGMRKRQMSAKPGLVIPLSTGSFHLTANVPSSLREIESQLDIETPSLYLLSWNIARCVEVYEEYKSPLAFELISASFKGAYAYYREFRDATAIKNGWEFSRCIYIEYFIE